MKSENKNKLKSSVISCENDYKYPMDAKKALKLFIKLRTDTIATIAITGDSISEDYFTVMCEEYVLLKKAEANNLEVSIENLGIEGFKFSVQTDILGNYTELENTNKKFTPEDIADFQKAFEERTYSKDIEDTPECSKECFKLPNDEIHHTDDCAFYSELSKAYGGEVELQSLHARVCLKVH